MVTKRTPTIDSGGKLLEKFIPDRLADTALNATYAPAAGSANYATPAAVTAAVAPKLDAATAATTYQAQSLPALYSGGRSWGFLGDSITNRSSAAAGRGYIDVLPWLVGTQHMALVAPNTPVTGAVVSRPAGVPGETTAQMLTRTDALIAQGINGMTLLGGTNDAGQAVSTATFLANVDAIARKCRKAGIPLVVGTVPPRSAATAASIRTSIAAYNLALRQWAPKNGVYLADTYSALADIATGSLLAAYDVDGTHPNTLGHYQLAAAFATAVKRVLLPQTPIVTAKSVTSLVSNPLFQAGSSGWYEQPGGTGTQPVFSTVADTTGRLPVGAQWREMDFDAVAGGSRTLATQLTNGSWAPGDVLLVAASIDVIDVAGYATAAKLDPATANFKLQTMNGGTPTSNYSMPPLPVAPGEIAITHLVPAGQTDILLWFTCSLPTGAHAKFRISAVDVRNLTALGVTGY